MTFLYQKSRCLIEAFSLHLKHLLLFLPTTMYEGSKKDPIFWIFQAGVERIELPSAVLETDVLPLYDTPKIKVTSTGFEPVSAAVKGRCVKPLHQLASAQIIYHRLLLYCNTFLKIICELYNS